MKDPIAFCRGSPCDANFCVGLHIYVITEPLYDRLKSHPTHLYGVAPYGGGPPGSSRPSALPPGHQEELGQTLLHQTGKALVVGLQRGAVYILDHCE